MISKRYKLEKCADGIIIQTWMQDGEGVDSIVGATHLTTEEIVKLARTVKEIA